MSNLTDIKDALKLAVKNGDDTYSIVCTVESIDTTRKTCVCEPVGGGAELMGVKLMAKNQTGFYIIPKVNSQVIVTITPEFVAYVAMFSEVSEIHLNGSDNSGVIKVVELLNEINTRNTTLKTAITTALTSIDASIVALGGVSSSGAAFTAATATLTNILKASVESTTVKHGNG
jgi:hypothetical protein